MNHPYVPLSRKWRKRLIRHDQNGKRVGYRILWADSAVSILPPELRWNPPWLIFMLMEHGKPHELSNLFRVSQPQGRSICSGGKGFWRKRMPFCNGKDRVNTRIERWLTSRWSSMVYTYKKNQTIVKDRVNYDIGAIGVVQKCTI